MTEDDKQTKNLDDMMASSDTGARNPQGSVGRYSLLVIPLLWSLYQLWIASPLPFELGIAVWNDTQTRAIHLAFAVLLAFIAYPTFTRSARDRIPLQDWGLGLIGAGASAYIWLFYAQIAERTGLPSTADVVIAAIGIVLLLEAARRSL